MKFVKPLLLGDTCQRTQLILWGLFIIYTIETETLP